jgi:2-oxoglutarate dehydrogenase E2 component (dihydrolipoamide succinyltransferase)
LVSKDGDYVEKDQAIAEVDSDKATLNYLLKLVDYHKAEGDAVVCSRSSSLFNDTGSLNQKGQLAPAAAQLPKRQPSSSTMATHARNTHLQQQENIRRKNIAPASVTGTGKDGRITKDAVNATPSMGTPRRKPGSERQNYQCCVVK